MTQPAPAAGPGQAPAPRALVLDVDGTLLDTVYLHVLAWWEAFREAGHDVPCVDLHHVIGRGSSDLVASLLEAPDSSVVDDVVEAHARHWSPLRERCRPFPQVQELIRSCAARGLQVVYCTSGAQEDVDDFRAKIGCDDVVAAVVSSADVGSSKPAPDIVLAALEAVGAAPQDAVMVGDTVYDVRAAQAAGVACVGVLCGGIGELDLREAGAAAVYADPAALLKDLAASPLARLLR